MGILGRAGSLAAAAAALHLAAGCGASGHAPSGVRTPFDYDMSLAVGMRDAGRVNTKYPIAIRDISYAVPGGRVRGYLTVPPGGGRLAAVVYLHGAGGERGQLLAPAVWLAGRRAIGLTITMPSSAAGRPPRRLTPSQELGLERRLFVADVVAARRAVDLLRSLPRVDPERIGLVGWSLGARVGAALAGVEPRIHAFVLMSGGATPVAAYAAKAPASLRPEVRRLLTPLDPLRWIHRARPGTILLQDGRMDAVVSQAALLRLAKAAPRGTLVRWYPSGHELNVAAYRGQLGWLARKLRIRGPAVAGAMTGP